MSLNSILKHIPFVRFAFALGLGVYFGSCFQYPSWPVLAILCAISGVLLFGSLSIPFFYQNYRNRWISGVLFFILLFQIGALLSRDSQPSQLVKSYDIKAVGKITEADITTSGYYRFVINPVKITSQDTIPLRKKDRWQIIVEPVDSVELLPATEGDVVGFKTRISGHSSASNPFSFDYGQYLFRQGISGTGFVLADDFKVMNKGEISGLMGNIREIRNEAREVYIENGIEGEELQVLSALTLGMRQDLDDEVKNRFIHSGAIHVLAVSGLHVGIIYLFLNILLDVFLSRTSVFRLIIVISMLTFYVFLTGASPSVFRAVVMLSIIQIGNFFNFKGNIYNLLGISAFIILIIQPQSLFHPGFWLSHFAVAGIVTFFPLFRRFYAHGNIFIRGAGDLASVSISAQIGTLPLSLYLFRAFPSWFLLTNFLILPLVAPVLIMSNLLIAFSEFPFMAAMFAGVLNELVGFMLGLVKWLDSLPAAYIQGLWMAPLTMVLMYVLICMFAFWHHFKQPLYFKMMLGSLLGVFIMFHFGYWQRKQTDAFVVFETGRYNTIGVIKKGTGALFTDPEINERNINFASSGFFARNAEKDERHYLWSDVNMKAQISVYTIKSGCYIGVGDINVDKISRDLLPEKNILGVL